MIFLAIFSVVIDVVLLANKQGFLLSHLCRDDVAVGSIPDLVNRFWVKWDGIGHELGLSSVFVVLSVYQHTRFMNTYFFVKVISRSSTGWTEEMDWAIVHATSKAMQAEVYRMNLSEEPWKDDHGYEELYNEQYKLYYVLSLVLFPHQ
ncbi:hypothetical protein H5410_002820 [Solanum commersonii]|uniref:Uncharacterized protein n=1 Tax=Solanum commersonii TaxID=4109 RepID=A0A9J6B3Y1_SOLCO|nr:hypothetical protein H5410_002820 [Solanum commersonii]